MTHRTYSRRDWLKLAGAAVAAGSLGGCKPRARSIDSNKDRADRPNIVVFLADTLRADHLSCYGRTPRTSPTLDALAEDGVLFENFIAASTWTKPSLGSLFTGLPPRVHGAVVSKGVVPFDDWPTGLRVQALRDEFVTLAEALKRLGYHTAYFQSNAHGRTEFGYGQGFDHIVFKPLHRPNVQVLDAISWIMSQAGEPFFVFIHEIDPHGPNEPSDHTFQRLHGTQRHDKFAQLETEEAELIQRFFAEYADHENRPPRNTLSQSATSYFKMLYDAEINEVDLQFRRIVNFLKHRGVFDDTVVAFTSDHGEGFREHGYFGHSWPLPYRELVHVPLIIAGGGLPAGERVPYTTSMMDFYPTIVELAGGSVPDYLPGKALFTAAGELAVTDDRVAYTDLDHQRETISSWNAAITRGRYKAATFDSGDRYRIFDYVSDPAEVENLVGTERIDIALQNDLISTLYGEIERFDALRGRFGDVQWIEGADEFEAQLRALGYL